MSAVSVVIPLYNKGPHIARAIQSVLNQTEQSFEIIIVDGQSTDEGPKIVKSLKDQRIFFYEQVGSGVSSARNEGVCHSKSDFIAFLDADDEWMPDHLETLLRLCRTYPEAGVYTTAYHIRYPNSRMVLANFHAVPEKPWEGLLPSYFKSAAFGDPPIWTSVVGIPKRILEEMGGFNTEAWWGEDTDLWGRIALKYPIAFSWNIGAIYHTEAVNRIPHRVMAVKENLFITTVKEYLAMQEVSPELLRDLYAYVDKKRVETAVINVRSGCLSLARQQLLSCRSRSITIKWLKVFILTLLPLSIITWLLTARQRMAL